MSSKYQTFWPRFGAGLVDALILWPLLFGFDWLLHRIPWMALWLPLYVVSLYSYSAYSIWMHGRFGWTLGKRFAGVRVLDLSERALSMRQAWLRDLIPLIITTLALALELPYLFSKEESALERYEIGAGILALANVGWFLAELLTMAFNPKRRALHDFIAGSVVVRSGYPVRADALSAQSR